MKITDVGTAAASSSFGSEYVPANAFRDDDELWYSKRKFPQSIWIRFANPHRLARIDIRSHTNRSAPKDFAVVGSADGVDWVTLLRVQDSGFPDDKKKEVKSWEIPAENRQSLSHIGLTVNTVPDMTWKCVKIEYLVMWEEEEKR